MNFWVSLNLSSKCDSEGVLFVMKGVLEKVDREFYKMANPQL